MNISEQLTNFDLSEKLKTLGIKQESLFCWTTPLDLEFLSSEIRNKNNVVAAFSVAELLDFFPLFNGSPFELLKGYDIRDGFITYCPRIQDISADYKIFKDRNPANSLAKMIIYLLEKNQLDGMNEEWRKQWLDI